MLILGNRLASPLHVRLHESMVFPCSGGDPAVFELPATSTAGATRVVDNACSGQGTSTRRTAAGSSAQGRYQGGAQRIRTISDCFARGGTTDRRNRRRRLRPSRVHRLHFQKQN